MEASTLTNVHLTSSAILIVKGKPEKVAAALWPPGELFIRGITAATQLEGPNGGKLFVNPGCVEFVAARPDEP